MRPSDIHAASVHMQLIQAAAWRDISRPLMLTRTWRFTCRSASELQIGKGEADSSMRACAARGRCIRPGTHDLIRSSHILPTSTHDFQVHDVDLVATGHTSERSPVYTTHNMAGSQFRITILLGVILVAMGVLFTTVAGQDVQSTLLLSEHGLDPAGCCSSGTTCLDSQHTSCYR